MFHVGLILFLGAISGACTYAANALFDAAWGAPHFFVIWIVLVCIVYGISFFFVDLEL